MAPATGLQRSQVPGVAGSGDSSALYSVADLPVALVSPTRRLCSASHMAPDDRLCRPCRAVDPLRLSTPTEGLEGAGYRSTRLLRPSTLHRIPRHLQVTGGRAARLSWDGDGGLRGVRHRVIKDGPPLGLILPAE